MLANSLAALADAANLPVDGHESPPNPGLPPLLPIRANGADERTETLLTEIRDYFGLEDTPHVFRALAIRPRLIEHLWRWWQTVFRDRELPRRTKVMIAYCAAATRNSAYGMALFGRELRHLGVGDDEMLAMLLSISWFNGVTKFADLLQVESDLTDEEIQTARAGSQTS